MTADGFTTAARAEAERLVPLDGGDPNLIFRDRRVLVEMAEWARAHLAAQEPTDAECIHVLSVVHTDLRQPTRKDFEWSQAAIQRCRDAIMAARDVRGQG